MKGADTGFDFRASLPLKLETLDLAAFVFVNKALLTTSCDHLLVYYLILFALQWQYEYLQQESYDPTVCYLTFTGRDCGFLPLTIMQSLKN